MSEKKGLKSIVPPPELCKRIPQGNFADSLFALVRYKDGIEFIMYREVAKGMLDIIAPAPTLQEILAEFDVLILAAAIEGDLTHRMDETKQYASSIGGLRRKVTSWETMIAPPIIAAPVPTVATAAMKLWLEVNGVEVGK